MGSLNVAGELRVDEFTIEKLKLQQLHLQGSLHDLQLDVPDGQAQWAGGVVRASMTAKFLPRPRYDVEARLTGVDLTQLPIAASVASRLGGVASGTLHLKTAGVGREELLQKLSGTGDVHVANLEFRGWDVNASVADGEAHAGVSRWATGDGDFSVGDRSVALEDVRLDGGAEVTFDQWDSQFRPRCRSFGGDQHREARGSQYERSRPGAENCRAARRPARHTSQNFAA